MAVLGPFPVDLPVFLTLSNRSKGHLERATRRMFKTKPTGHILLNIMLTIQNHLQLALFNIPKLLPGHQRQLQSCRGGRSSRPVGAHLLAHLGAAALLDGRGTFFFFFSGGGDFGLCFLVVFLSGCFLGCFFGSCFVGCCFCCCFCFSFFFFFEGENSPSRG